MTMQQQQFNKYFSLIFYSFVATDLNNKIKIQKKKIRGESPHYY